MEEVLFVDEPGKHLLEIKRWEDILLATLSWVDDGKSLARFDEHKGNVRILMTFEVSVKKFSMEVVNVLYDLGEKYGIEGYKLKWINAEFPKEKYSALVTSLKRYTHR